MVKRKNKKNKADSLVKGRVNKNKLSKRIFVIGIILLVFLILLILFNQGLLNGPREEVLFELRDECALVIGNILHPIEDSGDCLVKCRNECEIRNLEFERFEFEGRINSCNRCDCYCI